MSKKFNFVIARFWDEDEYPTEKGGLCVYSFGSEVQYGTKEKAYKLAESLNHRNVGGKKTYKPYFIDIDKEL